MIRFERSDTPKLLVIHEHPALRAQVRKHLENSGYEVVEATSCKQAIVIMHTYTFAGIIIDADVADCEIASPLSARSNTGNSQTPCIVLATNQVIRKKVKGFNCDLDDYILKPFKYLTLVDHVRGTLKASEKNAYITLEKIKSHDLTGHLGIKKTEFKLTSRQKLFLHILITNSPRAVCKKYFSEILYIGKKTPNNPCRSLVAMASRLRKRLQDVDSNVSIRSVRGIGYRASFKPNQKTQETQNKFKIR